MKKTFALIITLVLIVVSFVCGHYIGGRSARDTNLETIDKGSVVVPGYDYIRAKSADQAIPIDLYNPEENNCLLVISLHFPDGKEIFKSDFLRPGDAIDLIQLSDPVPVGIYEKSILRYCCFTMDGSRQLNGADVNFTLEVTQ